MLRDNPFKTVSSINYINANVAETLIGKQVKMEFYHDEVIKGVIENVYENVIHHIVIRSDKGELLKYPLREVTNYEEI